MLSWFRMYTEARTDAKLRALSDAEHRVWFHLLCFAAEQCDATRGSIVGFDEELLAVEVCNADTALLRATLNKLKALRIISEDEKGISFCAFAKRQQAKPSDAPERVRARVAEHRARRKAGGNTTVTPGNALHVIRNAVDKDIDLDNSYTNVSTQPPEPVEATEPLRGGADAPTLPQSPQGKNGPKRLKGEKELDYWLRIVKETPASERIAVLVRMAHEKIDIPLEPATYARIGSLAKKHTASLLAKHIMSAAAQHIDGDPLDYLTALCNKNGHSSNGRAAPPGPAPLASYAPATSPWAD